MLLWVHRSLCLVTVDYPLMSRSLINLLKGADSGDGDSSGSGDGDSGGDGTDVFKL